MTDNDGDGDDPFDELEADVGDREGDPFETLDAETEEFDQDDGKTDGSERDDPENPSPNYPTEESADFDPEDFGRQLDQSGRGDQPNGGETESENRKGQQEARSGMDFDVGRRERPGGEDPFSDVSDREGDPFESFEDVFAEQDVEQIDPDVVWQELTSAESRGSVGEAQQRTYAEVSKHSFCEQCEHFSSPPDVHCTHEGTEIVEFLDMETVRVVDCPIVTEREKLEESDGFGSK